MESQSYRPDIFEMPPYRLGRHWNTIQAYLIPGLEDDIGELSEELKKFMGICELLIDEKMFAKYRWCGNGRPPSSRISLFKAYILKAMRNYPYTKTLIAAVRESPTVRRLCGWESVADIRAATFLFFYEFHVHFSLPFGKETTLDCLPMASKPVSAAVFALLVHVFSSSIRAVCHLEHPRIKIYTLYTFYTAIKEGFATASLIHEQTSWSRHINPPVRTPSPAEANVRASRTLPSNQPVDRSRPAVHFDAVSGSILPHQPCLAQVPAEGSCKTNTS